MASRIVVEGDDAARRRLEHLAAAVHATVRQEIQRTAVRIQAGARRRLHEHGTSDTGRLANSIAIETHDGGLEARIGTNLVYARAIEFGLPPGYLRRMPPVDAIAGWVRRKLGVRDREEARSIAFAIARKIQRSGTEPQPYLFPAAEAERRGFRRRLQRAVREALREAARG
ncbi:MAG TPA: HK97 gp10 family phage protein [Longimicrobiales bacterium]